MIPVNGRRLLAYLRPYLWPYFVGAMVCMVLFSATNGVMPFLVRFIFDDIFTGKNMRMLQLLPAAVLVTFLVRGVLQYGSDYLGDYVGNRIVTDLRNRTNPITSSTCPCPSSTANATGTILSRVSNDVFVVGNALTDVVASLLRDSVSLIVLVVVAFWNDWLLSLIAFVAFPASVVPIIRLSKKLRRFARKRQTSLGTLTALLQETVQGNRVVKAFGMEEYEKRRFAEESEGLFRLAMKVVRIRAVTTPMLETLAAFGIAGVVWYGGYSVITEEGRRGASSPF